MAKKKKVRWKLVIGQYTCQGVRILPGGTMSFPSGVDPNTQFAGSIWEMEGKDEPVEEEEDIKIGGTDNEDDGPDVPEPPPAEKQPGGKIRVT